MMKKTASSYTPSEHGSDDSAASSDANNDLNLVADPDDIAGVAEHDDKDEEPNDNDDGYIEIAVVDNNANNNEITGASGCR